MVQKVSGGVQEAPRSPPDPIKKYEFIRKFDIFLTYFLLSIVLPIVLAIVLPIELPIVLPIVLPIILPIVLPTLYMSAIFIIDFNIIFI